MFSKIIERSDARKSKNLPTETPVDKKSILKEENFVSPTEKKQVKIVDEYEKARNARE